MRTLRISYDPFQDFDERGEVARRPDWKGFENPMAEKMANNPSSEHNYC
jgi:hypothetical protein